MENCRKFVALNLKIKENYEESYRMCSGGMDSCERRTSRIANISVNHF